MRVTGGSLRGRKLRSPQGGLRPTADRVREAVFAALGDPAECGVLDLYAGTGSLGIEALSRGAARAVFVERAARGVVSLRANLAALGLADRARVLRGDAVQVLHRMSHTGERFDLVLVDPPYASGEVPRALVALLEGGLLAPGATVVVESGRRHPWAPVAGLVAGDERRYGDTVITRLRAQEGTPAA